MAYKISVKASKDLEEIWLYTVRNWSVEQADKYLKLIFQEIERLAAKPGSGKNFSFVLEDYRYAKVKSHLVFYKWEQTEADIKIVRILHQGMDLAKRLSE